MREFEVKRTRGAAAVTVPSQRRFLDYFAKAGFVYMQASI